MNIEGNITIVAMQPEQLTTIASWQQGERARYADSGDLSQRIERLSSHIGSNIFPATYVACAGDTPIGCVSLVYYFASASTQGNQKKQGLWLSNLYVLPEYRRQGLASHLLGHCRQQCVEQDVDTLQLFTADLSKYYQARGWTYHRRARVSGIDVDILQLKIDQQC